MLIAGLKNIYVYRHTLWSMSVSQLRAKYAGSILGISWAVFTPLLISVAVNFVFTQVMKTEIRAFSLFVLSALLPWFLFSGALSESATTMRQNAGLLKQFTIPKVIIPVSMVLSNFVNFLFGLLVILPVFIICDITIIKYLALLPLIILAQLIFIMGVCLFLSALGVYFQDLSQILNILLMLLFWLTPVFYSIQSIPLNWRWLILLNPVTCYMDIYRSLLYGGSHGDLGIWALCFIFALISILVGYIFFMRKESELLKYI